MAKTTVFYVIFCVGLWYIAFGGNGNLITLLPFPNSVQINHSADLSDFYTNSWRDQVTKYYINAYQQLHCKSLKFINPFCYIKPFKINHSTNLASTYFVPKQKSTYLEEYVYPLTDSLIIDGWEPYNKTGKAFNKSSQPLIKVNKKYNSEVTIRLYQSTFINRFIIYILIWTGFILEIKIFNKIFKKNE